MHAFRVTHPPPACLYYITPLYQFSSPKEDISLSNDELDGGGGCVSREGVLHAYSFVVGKRSYIVYTCGFVSKLEMDFTLNPTLPTLLHPLYVYDIISCRHQVRPIHNTYKYIYYYYISIKS